MLMLRAPSCCIVTPNTAGFRVYYFSARKRGSYYGYNKSRVRCIK